MTYVGRRRRTKERWRTPKVLKLGPCTLPFLVPPCRSGGWRETLLPRHQLVCSFFTYILRYLGAPHRFSIFLIHPPFFCVFPSIAGRQYSSPICSFHPSLLFPVFVSGFISTYFPPHRGPLVQFQIPLLIWQNYAVHVNEKCFSEMVERYVPSIYIPLPFLQLFLSGQPPWWPVSE